MSRLYLDYETHPFERPITAPPIVCTSFARDADPVDVVMWRDTPIDEWITDEKTTLVGASTSFEMLVTQAARPDLTLAICNAYMSGRIVDVLLDMKMLDIAAGRYRKGMSWSLAAGARRCGRELEKSEWRTRYKALDGIEVKYYPEGARNYSAEDTVATREVDLMNSAELALWLQRGINPLGRHAMVGAAADWTLRRASAWGVCTDPKRTEELAARVHAHMDEMRKTLQATGLIRASGTRDDKAAARRMLELSRASGRQLKLTDAGEKRLGNGETYDQIVNSLEGICMDKDEAILSGDEPMMMRADWITSNLLRGRVERMRQGHVFPLQTRFDSCKETFRTSSTQPSEPIVGEQMQNFPRGKKEDAYGLREVFCPRGPVMLYNGELMDYDMFIGGDLSQAELHCLSQVNRKKFGWSRMGDLLNEGIDLHWHFAAASKGMTIPEVQALQGDDRDRAKPANFGFPGGMGPDSFILYSRKGYGVRFERDEVVRLKQQWLSTFPEMRLYLKWIGEQGEPWTSIHPITEFVRGGLQYTNGANHNFQHLCAYAAKVALVQVDIATMTPGNPLYGWRIWNFVHDEILLEGNRKGASAAAKELARIMSVCFNQFVPDYPTHVDAFVTKVWSKKCKTITNEQGDILEWQPKAA